MQNEKSRDEDAYRLYVHEHAHTHQLSFGVIADQATT